MRDEVDLEKLQAALVNVVQETMQPKVVGLWVQKPEHSDLGKNTMTEKTGHPFLYNFVLILIVPILILLVVVSGDLITHPLAIDRSGSAAVRLLTGGFTAPLTVLVALFIMRRVPGNVIGPLLILWAANIAWTALRTDIDVPLLPVISDLSWYSLLIIALYFPTGRSHWKRYERWVDILCASVLLLLIVNWVGQESLMRGQMVENVLYVPIIARLQPLLTPFEVLIPFLIIGLALVSLFLRFRAAGTQERQQMKWLVWGFVMFLVTAIPFKIILWTTDSIDPTLNEIYSRFIYIFPALTIGMAILRHRLWDIDIIIPQDTDLFDFHGCAGSAVLRWCGGRSGATASNNGGGF